MTRLPALEGKEVVAVLEKGARKGVAVPGPLETALHQCAAVK